MINNPCIADIYHNLASYRKIHLFDSALWKFNMTTVAIVKQLWVLSKTESALGFFENDNAPLKQDGKLDSSKPE